MAAAAKVIKFVVPRDVQSALRAGERITPSQLRTVRSFYNSSASIVARAANKNSPDYLVAQTAQLILASAYVYVKLFQEPLEVLIRQAFSDDWVIVRNPVSPPELGWVLPSGVEWFRGPCPVWDGQQFPPVPALNLIDVCTSGALPVGSIPDVPPSDEAITAWLAAGNYLGYINWTFEPSIDQWVYRGYGSVVVTDPDAFTGYDSNANGLVPLYNQFVTPIFDPVDWPKIMEGLEFIFSGLGLPPLADAAAQLPATWPSLPANPYADPLWWTEGPLEIPLALPHGKPHVGFPSPRWDQKPGFNVRPSELPGSYPAKLPNLRPGLRPAVKPARLVEAAGTQFSTQTRVLNKINAVASVVAGPVRPPDANTHERKPGGSRAVWLAMQTVGAVSEIADVVDATYKALPSQIRRDALEANGKTLNTAEKLKQLYEHYKEIDLAKAIALIIVQNIDDLISAKIAEPFDKWLQKAVPDFLTRQAVRQAIRWAYWESNMEDDLDKILPDRPNLESLLGEAIDQQPSRKLSDIY